MAVARPKYLHGEIWRVEFFEGGLRPAVVVSRNELNRGRLILVVPCTSSKIEERKPFPNHVFLPSGSGGLAKDSIAQTHLIQSVEAALLIDRIGILPDGAVLEILLALAWTTGFFDSLG